jgi:hypothetical protein
MIGFARYSPMPLLALYKGGRGAYLLAARITIGGFFAMLCLYQSVGGLDSLYADDLEVTRVRWLSLLLFVVPFGIAGALTDASNELRVCEATRLLPGLQRQVQRSALVIEMVTIVGIAIPMILAFQAAGLSMSISGGLTPTLSAGLMLSSLGFACGCWASFSDMVLKLWLRCLIFLGLSCAAPFLLVAASEEQWLLLPFVICCISWVLAHHRFSSKSSHRDPDEPGWTILNMGSGIRRPVLQEQRDEKKNDRKNRLLPPARLGGSAAGWIAAQRYQVATGNFLFSATGYAWRLPIFVVLSSIVVQTLIQLLPWSRETPPSFQGIAEWLLTSSDLGDSVSMGVLSSSSFLFAFIVAVLATQPVLGPSLCPLSRKLQSALVMRAASVVGPVYGGAFLALSLGLGRGIAWLSDMPIPSGEPYVLVIAIALIVAFPFLVVLSLMARTALMAKTMSPFAWTVAAPIVMLVIGVTWGTRISIMQVVLGGMESGEGGIYWPFWIGYVFVLLISYVIMRYFIKRHFQKADLA